MHAVLCGPSALAWWIAYEPLAKLLQPAGAAVLSQSAPTLTVSNYLMAHFPYLKAPLHFISETQGVDRSRRWISHQTQYRYPAGSFYQIGSGIYITSPELSFIQSCLALSPHQSLKAGGALCGQFCIDPHTFTGLADRQPLTTSKNLRTYAQEASGLHGSKRVMGLISSIPVNAASPPEAFLAIAFQGAPRLGGFGLPAPILNQRIIPTPRASRIAQRSSLVPDLLWPESKLVIEFDSDAVHLDKQQIARDAAKRLALDMDGYRTITITTSQAASRTAIRNIAREVSRYLGIKFRQRSQHFDKQNRALFQEGSSLDFLFQTEAFPASSPNPPTR